MLALRDISEAKSERARLQQRALSPYYGLLFGFGVLAHANVILLLGYGSK